MTNLFDIAGKSALVTGGSRGIGLMIARGFVEAGATVYISSRKAEVCDAVAAELSELGTCVSIPPTFRTTTSAPAGRRGRGAARRARHPRQQRGRHVGRAARRLPRRRLGQGHDPQHQGAVPADPGPRPRARGRGHRRRSGPGHQHRLDRRHPGSHHGDLRVFDEQGRHPPADPPSRAANSGRSTSRSTRSRRARSSRR